MWTDRVTDCGQVWQNELEAALQQGGGLTKTSQDLLCWRLWEESGWTHRDSYKRLHWLTGLTMEATGATEFLFDKMYFLFKFRARNSLLTCSRTLVKLVMMKRNKMTQLL